jgi:hypothetical protein
MKKLVIIFSLLTFGIACHAQSIRLPIAIEITGAFHRGKSGCDCTTCFGLCNVKFKITLVANRVANIPESNGVIKLNGDGTGTVYILKSLDNAEPVFGVDEDISALGDESLSGFRSMTIHKGEYSYQSKEEDVVLGGKPYHVYGNVTVNITLIK